MLTVPRPMIRAAAAASLLGLTSCAGPTWTKGNVTNAEASADFSDCQGMAQQATARDTAIDQDIIASRGNDWSQRGTLDLHKTVLNQASQERSDQVVQACMEGKGYSLKE